MIDINQR